MSALSLAAGTLALAPSLSTSFGASGGSSPYTYSVRANGAGGSIDSSGLYTAPASANSTQPYDTVIATDSVGATTSLQILVGNALLLFCDIIQNQLGLENGQVYLYNQKYNIPTDSKLYIAVRILTCKPFGSTNSQNGSGGGVNSDQFVSMQATLSVNLLSRGPDARDRKEEVILALKSNYSQTQQTTNSFYVAGLSSNFVDISDVDGPAIPYRFNISVNIQYAFKKTQAVPYFSSFQKTAVTTEP